MNAYATLLLKLSNLTTLDVSGDRLTKEVGTCWPLEVDGEPLEYSKKDRRIPSEYQFNLLFKLATEIRKIKSEFPFNYLSNLRHLNLSYVNLGITSLVTFFANMQVEGEGNPCLITTWKCYWFKMTEVPAAHPVLEYDLYDCLEVPNVTNMKWYEFISLAYGMLY